MSFDVGADAYGRFMGRYSEPLAAQFVALVDARPGQQALDVGCGPGALTAQLVARVGSTAVTAIDPSEPFVAAVRSRLPGIDARWGVVEALPFADDSFDLSLAQLVVHFMADPVAGLAEMARVTRPDGVVGACVWDHAGDRGPLSVFWQAACDLNSQAPDESKLAGVREGQLLELFEQAGLRSISPATLTVRVGFPSFQDWWEPFTLGVGPAGGYVSALDAHGREELQSRCAELLPEGAFELEVSAWAALGRA